MPMTFRVSKRFSMLVAAALLLAFLCETAVSAKPTLPDFAKALWIWSSEKAVAAGELENYFRKTFDLTEAVTSATILVTADNEYDLFVNGSFVGGDGGRGTVYWKSVERYQVGPLLKPGENVIAIHGVTLGGSAGLALVARIELASGAVTEIRTDKSWRVNLISDTGWWGMPYDDSPWKHAVKIAPVGEGPWGAVSYPNPVSPGVRGRTTFAQPSADFEWPDGIVFLEGFVDFKQPENFIVRVRGSRAYFEHDAASPAALGHRLMKLSPASPGGQIETLVDAGAGVIGPPSVSYDGRTVFFTMAREGEAFFDVYRVGADGSGLRALTSGPFHDFDPEPAPDGGIVFSSTRIGSRDEYHGNVASSLFVMDGDGANIRPLTSHIVADREPRVTADGSVAFIRADIFFERAKVETRIHQVRTDGTGGIIVLGVERSAIERDALNAAEDNSDWLRKNGFGSPAALPDGRVAALTRRGLLVSGAFGPETVDVSSSLFDISPLPDGRLLCTGLARRWLGVLDIDGGGIVQIHQARDIHAPVALAPRPRPTEQAASVKPELEAGNETGFLFCQSAFITKQTGADMNRVKAIRVIEGRPFTLRSVHHRYVHIGVEAVELGEVPLAPDGSFFVEVPADRALALQAIDAEGRNVVSEMSWIYVRPDETRSCVGCHSPRAGAPPSGMSPLAGRTAPLRLTGKGSPHRYRGNNAANGGVLNLQMDRFREAGTIDLYSVTPQLTLADADERISAARRLNALRDPSTAKTLVEALGDSEVEARVAAAMALATCGDRASVTGLQTALDDTNPLVAQAANVALENLTGHSTDFNAFDHKGDDWREWLADNDWDVIEAKLIARLDADDATVIAPLGLIGSNAAGETLRNYLLRNPGDELRNLMSAMRALGRLKDEAAISLLVDIFNQNARKNPGKAKKLHELGWLQRPTYLTATAVEALGRIGSPEAERALIDAFPQLLEFWTYTYRSGDHTWLMGCHSSIVHYRFLEAFDALESSDTVELVPDILRSIPIDPDRALLFENDGYETLAARVVQRSGLAPDVIETCLSVLGDPTARAIPELLDAVTSSPPAVSVKPHDAESRAAQILSVVCLDTREADRIRDAFDRHRVTASSRTRAWVCFFLARTLGKIGDRGAVDVLLAALADEPTEASYGFETPPNVFIYKARAPFYRAAVADALGRIGDPRSAPILLQIAGDFDNAISVRHAAARALGTVCDESSLAALSALADDYPEVATRRALLKACELTRASSFGVD